MTEKNLLSVVVPFYNAEPFLKESLESIVGQTYSPIEIVAVNDGSTDNGDEYVMTLSTVRYIQQDHQGPAAARNLGVKMCGGNYIGFHDADDICLPQRFDRQMAIFSLYPDVDLVYTMIENFFEFESEVPPHMRTPKLMKPRMGFVSSAVMKRNVFDKVGLFNAKLKIGEDVDWMTRADEKGIRTCSIPEVLIKRRLHSGNTSQDILSSHHNLTKIIREKINRKKEG